MCRKPMVNNVAMKGRYSARADVEMFDENDRNTRKSRHPR